jgi:WD40 repeat protein
MRVAPVLGVVLLSSAAACTAEIQNHPRLPSDPANGSVANTPSHPWTIVWRTRPQDGYLWDLCFSPDGKAIVTAGYDRTARVWDAQTGRQKLILRGHSDALYNVSYSPDGTKILTSAEGCPGESKLWDAQSGSLLHTIKGCRGEFSEDGLRLLTIEGLNGSGMEFYRFSDAITGQTLAPFNGEDFHPRSWHHLGFQAASGILSSAALMHHTRLSRCQSVYLDHGGDVHSIVDAGTGKQVSSFSEPRVGAAILSPDGTWVATCSMNDRSQPYGNVLKVWDARSGTLSAVLQGHSVRVIAMAWSPLGDKLVTTGEDRTAVLWSVPRI